jgi:hypothetical protein
MVQLSGVQVRSDAGRKCVKFMTGPAPDALRGSPSACAVFTTPRKGNFHLRFCNCL